MSSPRSKNKFGARRTKCLRGHYHRSGLEAGTCDLLLAMEQKGECKLVQCEKKLYLSEARIGYIADFWLLDRDGRDYFAEAKGKEMPTWRQIKKLWRVFGPGPLHIYKGDYRRPKRVEIIIPERRDAA